MGPMSTIRRDREKRRGKKGEKKNQSEVWDATKGDAFTRAGGNGKMKWIIWCGKQEVRRETGGVVCLQKGKIFN